MRVAKNETWDPLRDFNWATLFERYDQATKKFNPQVPYLDCLGCRPHCERELYRVLVLRFGTEAATPTGITLDTFGAMLYWKYYFDPRIAKTRCERLRVPSFGANVQERLRQFSKTISRKVGRSRDQVLHLVKTLAELKLWCMAGNALPTQTTFLHFVFPETIPIFDKQVTKNFDWGDEKRPPEMMCDYMEHVWALSDKYSGVLPTGVPETPVRLVEMALWVLRGSGSKSCSE